ncbi:hypothetical protein N9X46_02410 [Paracoccaceae bacterium]|nr:hypothetical protein [Paracoccaceae bacterium]
MELRKEKFEWSPGYGGDTFDYEIELSTENSSEQTIELVKTSCIILSNDGATVGGDFNSEEDIYMDPGETAKFNVNCGYGNIFQSAADGEANSVEAQIDTTFFRREFFNLGEVEVPADDGEVARLVVSKNVAGGDLKILGATVAREHSDDADRTINSCVGLRNLGADAQQKVMVKSILIDRAGAQIDYSEHEEMIPPRSSAIISPSVCTKAGRLKGASIRITVTLFQPVASSSVSVDFPTKQN